MNTERARSEIQKFPTFVPRFIVSVIQTGRDGVLDRFVLGPAVTLPANSARACHEADRLMVHD